MSALTEKSSVHVISYVVLTAQKRMIAHSSQTTILTSLEDRLSGGAGGPLGSKVSDLCWEELTLGFEWIAVLTPFPFCRFAGWVRMSWLLKGVSFRS